MVIENIINISLVDCYLLDQIQPVLVREMTMQRVHPSWMPDSDSDSVLCNVNTLLPSYEIKLEWTADHSCFSRYRVHVVDTTTSNATVYPARFYRDPCGPQPCRLDGSRRLKEPKTREGFDSFPVCDVGASLAAMKEVCVKTNFTCIAILLSSNRLITFEAGLTACLSTVTSTSMPRDSSPRPLASRRAK